MDSAELPHYTVRVSRRAKYLRIRIDLHGQVEVVTPGRIDPAQISAFVARERDWILRTQERFLRQGRPSEPISRAPPERISLRALGQDIPVIYRRTQATRVSARLDPKQQLIVSGASADEAGVRKALMRWLHRQAQQHLIAQLSTLSQHSALPYQQARIRAQKTLWGSCTHKKTISLNCKLLFLPEELVRYVLLHELAHTRHMNHSKHFWALLETLEPQARTLDAALRQAGAYVPPWSGP